MPVPDLKDGEVHIVEPIHFHSAGYTEPEPHHLERLDLDDLPRPEPNILIETVKKYKPNFLPGVASIFVGLLADKEFRSMDKSFLKGFFTGASPIAADTVQDLKKLTGKDVYEIYGMTENTAFATATPWGGKVKPGTVGLPLPNTELKVVDLDEGTTVLKPGEAGEICIKGPQVMRGTTSVDETATGHRDAGSTRGTSEIMDEEGYSAS